MRRVMDMHEIRTKRLLLRPFRESDYDDLFEFLSQLADDEFEGYPGIIYENGQEHLKYHISVSGHQAKGNIAFIRIPGGQE
jgi:hypothetical protein